MMRTKERGAGNIGCLVGLVALALVIVVAVKAIPQKIAVADFKDSAVREAEQAGLQDHTNDAIRDRLLRKAKELELPVSKEQLSVTRDDNKVYVEYKYRVVVDLLVKKYNWDVEEKIERILF